VSHAAHDPEKVLAARQLRAEGETVRAIADLLDAPRSTVQRWIDPDAAEKQRKRRERYKGTCTVCGKKTDGSMGRAHAPTLCLEHSREMQHNRRYWTKERILKAFAAYHETYGDQPSASEILSLRPGMWFPAVGTVQREFGSWSAAITAAGWRPNAKVCTPHPTHGGHGMHGYIILEQNGDGSYHDVAHIDAPKREDALRKYMASLPEEQRHGIFATVPKSQWAPRRVSLKMKPILQFDPVD
jgi:hypothetical protein